MTMDWMWPLSRPRALSLQAISQSFQLLKNLEFFIYISIHLWATFGLWAFRTGMEFYFKACIGRHWLLQSQIRKSESSVPQEQTEALIITLRLRIRFDFRVTDAINWDCGGKLLYLHSIWHLISKTFAIQKKWKLWASTQVICIYK